ncbi:hypothetical protein AYK26_06645 [Euryarchaeota archaeon SM23-78]|nr:MAG: hypothetical protein AYK26_06645 [Euryarchaeota archaeon SM23-78]MBW3000943.1 hypothetical protein [Candidatus Woesearchaeota archaeon]
MNNNLERIIEELKEKTVLAIPSTVSYLSGLGLGLLGKHIKKEWIPVLPPAIDLFGGSVNINTLFYGAGVATAYLPEIYQLLKNI